MNNCGNEFPTSEIREVASNKWICKPGSYDSWLCPEAYFSIRSGMKLWVEYWQNQANKNSTP